MVCIDEEYRIRLLESVKNGDELTKQEIADLLWGAAKIVDQRYIGHNIARQPIRSVITFDDCYYAIDWVRTPHKVYFGKQPYKVEKPKEMNHGIK